MLYWIKFLHRRACSLYALLLSLVAHVYLLSAFGLSEGWALPSTVSLKQAGVFSVQLISTDRNNSGHAAGAQVEIEGMREATEPEAKSKEMVLPVPRSPDIVPWLHLPVKVQTEPHYFRASELTQKPVFLDGVPDNLYLTVPGEASQTAVLKLLINERGEVDRVLVDDSGLSIEAEKLLVEVFSGAKFYPGKIGESPVKSQLKIETVLESAVNDKDRD